MPSKGIDFYGFVAEGFVVEVRAHSANDTKHFSARLAPGSTWQHVHYEVETDWGGLYYEGYFQFIARRQNGEQLFERSMRVNAITGGINDDDLRNMLIPAVIGDGYCLSFGVYNSDAAIVSGLPNAHQVWASLTRSQADWQGQLLDDFERTGRALAELPFGKLVLPGSHDAGMYRPELPIQIADLANTQKDATRQQLELGARYFDFRPGRIRPDWESIVDNLPADGPFGWLLEFVKRFGIRALASVIGAVAGQLCHVHAVIPGATFDDFLRTVVDFLRQHPREVVYVRLKSSGFVAGAVETPSREELQGIVARHLAGTGMEAAGKEAFGQSVGALLDAHRRLIIGYDADDIATFSTYSDAYQSYDPQRIIDGLQKINDADLTTTLWIDGQLQLTSTAEAGAITRSIMATEPGTSPLMATKPRADARSYEWLQRDLKPKRTDVLLTLCNDFYDNGLTEVARAVSRKRLGIKQ